MYFKNIGPNAYMYASIDYYLLYTCKFISYIEYGLRCVNEIFTQKIFNHNPCNL